MFKKILGVAMIVCGVVGGIGTYFSGVKPMSVHSVFIGIILAQIWVFAAWQVMNRK